MYSSCEEDAVECLRQIPDHALANFLMGMVRYHTCKPEFAEDFFQRSFRKDGNAAAQAGLGAIQLQRKNYAEAERLLEESYRKDPDRIFTGYLYALSCIEQKKLDLAKTLLDPLLEKHPDDLMVQYTNLRYLSASRKIEAAYQLTRKLQPELNRLMPNLDHLFATWEQAIFHCQPALLFSQVASHGIFSELMCLVRSSSAPSSSSLALSSSITSSSSSCLWQVHSSTTKRWGWTR